MMCPTGIKFMITRCRRAGKAGHANGRAEPHEMGCSNTQKMHEMDGVDGEEPDN